MTSNAEIDVVLCDARRVLSLQGGVNFRDLGGYSTEDGRRVKWGQLYRSGSMGGLTKPDYETLAALNIRSVCDLRTRDEREAAPNLWAQAAGIEYWCRDYDSSFGVLRSLLSSGLANAAAARAALVAGYRRLPREHAPAYRAVFSRLKSAAVPLVLNCSAGKDRAGTAAALLLRALGVPPATILADYRLTDRVLDFSRLAAAGLQPAGGRRGEDVLSRVPAEVLAVVMGTDQSYIEAVFAVIDEEYGSIEAYFRDELTLSPTDVTLLRNMLLEPGVMSE